MAEKKKWREERKKEREREGRERQRDSERMKERVLNARFTSQCKPLPF
jgi:hypothetical protein